MAESQTADNRPPWAYSCRHGRSPDHSRGGFGLLEFRLRAAPCWVFGEGENVDDDIQGSRRLDGRAVWLLWKRAASPRSKYTTTVPRDQGGLLQEFRTTLVSELRVGFISHERRLAALLLSEPRMTSFHRAAPYLGPYFAERTLTTQRTLFAVTAIAPPRIGCRACGGR